MAGPLSRAGKVFYPSFGPRLCRWRLAYDPVAFLCCETSSSVSYNGGWLGPARPQTYFKKNENNIIYSGVVVLPDAEQSSGDESFPWSRLCCSWELRRRKPPANGPQGLNRQPEEMWERQFLLGDLNDLRNQILYRGFSFSPVLIGEVMGNVSGGDRRGVIFDGVLNLGFDIDWSG